VRGAQAAVQYPEAIKKRLAEFCASGYLLGREFAAFRP
jgi:hypothetical protein